MLKEVLTRIEEIIDEEHRAFVARRCCYCNTCARLGWRYSCPDWNRWRKRYVMPRIKEVLEEYIKGDTQL